MTQYNLLIMEYGIDRHAVMDHGDFFCQLAEPSDGKWESGILTERITNPLWISIFKVNRCYKQSI